LQLNLLMNLKFFQKFVHSLYCNILF